uniref:Uncharacterized protein n=1 Tax=Arundo donax TaxID=35708 RepID=A0A0A9EN20_ARUDO
MCTNTISSIRSDLNGPS